MQVVTVGKLNIMKDARLGQRRWISLFIIVGAVYFMSALFVAAIFEPDIRVLHAFQALIYIAVIVLTSRNSAWGFGISCLNGAFWNYIFIVGAADKLWDCSPGIFSGPILFCKLLATSYIYQIQKLC